MQTTRVILLRHGQCEGGDILRGQVDVCLSEQGKLQMQQAFSELLLTAAPKLAATQLVVLSSPLLRCAIPAKAFAESKQLALFIEPGFKELNFGDWDGQTFDALYQSHAQALDNYWANPWLATPPNGESMQAFEQRIEQAWQDMLLQHRGKQIVVVSHGGVIRHLLSKALGATQCVGFYTSLKLPYAAKVCIDVLHHEQEQHLSVHWG